MRNFYPWPRSANEERLGNATAERWQWLLTCSRNSLTRNLSRWFCAHSVCFISDDNKIVHRTGKFNAAFDSKTLSAIGDK